MAEKNCYSDLQVLHVSPLLELCPHPQWWDGVGARSGGVGACSKVKVSTVG